MRSMRVRSSRLPSTYVLVSGSMILSSSAFTPGLLRSLFALVIASSKNWLRRLTAAGR